MFSILEHVPFAASPTQREIGFIAAAGTPGEVISCSFSLQALQPLDMLSIHCTALTGAQDTIGEDRVDLHIVKKWQVSGLGVYQSEPLEVGELLLKDDAADLSDRYRKDYCDWRDIVKPSWRYKPPAVRTDGPVRIRLQPQQTKQLWLTVAIPQDISPGNYKGAIVITGPALVRELPVTVEVLPFKLLQPPQDLMLWYRGCLDQSNAQHGVDRRMFQLQLQDIFDHGFTSITINESQWELAQNAIDIAEEIGFNRHLVFTPPFPQEFGRLRFGRTTPVLYLSDEMDAQPAGKQILAIQHHVNNWRLSESFSVQTMCSLLDCNFRMRLLDSADIGHPPAIASYYLPTSRSYFALNSQFEQVHEPLAYFYWMAHMEKPDVHRVLSGCYLWKSKAAGISPYCYQHLPVYPYSPFDDFDLWEPEFQIGEETGTFRHHLSTYPCRRGIISTLQWEGMRHGITDLKYLHTLDRLLQSAIAEGVDADVIAEITAGVRNFLKRVNLATVTINSPSEPEPFAELSPEDYWLFRAQLCGFIQEIIGLGGTVGNEQTICS